MKNLRYYISLILILSASIILLSTSYSKESGILLNNSTTKEEINNIQITYSKTNIINPNEENYINIVNKNKHTVTYEIELLKKDDNTEEIYYQLDNNDIKVIKKNSVIIEEELSPYGTENDTITHRLNIQSNKNNKYIINIKETTRLNNIIKKDQTYEKNNNYYYYGNKPNNYLLYENEIYQILGIENNKVKLISLRKELKEYEINNNYPTIQDILNSIKEDISKESITEYETYLLDESYWLKDEYNYYSNYYYARDNTFKISNKNILHFTKEIKYIDGNIKVIKGSGTKEEPYEVEYESS